MSEPLTPIGVVLRLHPDDSVGVALRSLADGSAFAVGDQHVIARQPIPRGHKVALRDVAAAEPVYKYGQLIGISSMAITRGDHVHMHNLAFIADHDSGGEVSRDYAFAVDAREPDLLPVSRRATFDGIVRADGQVATRNYLGILTSVNCSATIAKFVADAFRGPALAEFPNVDGVVALTHGTGCGMAGAGAGFDILRRTLSGYAHHPNFAGFLVIGLGCEVNQVDALTADFDLPSSTPMEAMTIQELGGTAATVREGVSRLRDMLPLADAVRRTPVSASEIVLALQCGGSDAYSGITANPALGAAADILVRNGGTAILGETPEVYGAEHLLTRRAVTSEVGERLVERIDWWEKYTAANGGSMDNNPSPGNKDGGLTTILEKSLGAVAKGGTSNLNAVYEYAERATAKGLVFMDTPGYDPVSMTGMVAGGANVACFTTGRGSVYGCKPAPTIKLASNTETYERMSDDMDLNCGVILDGEADVAEVGQRIFDAVLDVASGHRTRSEQLDFGSEEFAPWQIGAVM